MATKDHCLSFNNKKHKTFGVNAASNGQYSNLNLNNHNKKCLPENTVISTTKYVGTNESRKSDKNDSQNKREKFDWEKAMKASDFYKQAFERQKENHQKEFNYREKSSNKSTLSLHITAYENSIEIISSDLKNNDDENAVIKKKKVEKGFIKNWKNAMESSVNAAFEFPRQQQDQKNDPEVMQFKASQRLFNPNQAPPSESTMTSLKNDDFRKLLTTSKSRPAAESSSQQSSTSSASNRRNDKKPSGGGKKKFHHNKKKDEEEKTDVDKIFDESQQHLTEIMKGYRDRAAERRKADTNKETDEAALRLMIHGIMPTDLEKNRGELTIEQSKLLGGDIEHTHMVKGLDYALLEKMKTDKDESDEEEDDEKDVPASSLAPEKVAKNPMVRRTLRTIFHTVYPKRNEHFAPGRMAYVCDFDNVDTDVPSTLLRSLEETPKENPSVKTDKLILEHLTNILPYLRDKKRQKKKKKHVDDEEEAKALGEIKIFDDAGDYDTRVKPLKQERGRSDRDSHKDKDEKRSYFNDSRDDKRSRRDDDKDDSRRRESDRYRKRDDDSRNRRDRSPSDRRDRERERDRHHHRDRTPERSRDKDHRRDEPKKSSIFDKHSSSSADNRKRSAVSPSTAEAKSNKKIKQDEAYGEYFTEDMDFVETIASDDDDDEALAIAKSRMFHEMGTDAADGKGKKPLDKKKPNQSKADVARKFDNELKKIDEIWAKKKDTKMNY